MLSLKTELDDVTAQHEACRDILAAHKDAAAAEVINHHKEIKKLLDKKDNEIKSLKASIQNNNSENLRLNAEVKSLQKALKTKESEIYNLEKWKDNFQNTIRTTKKNLNDLKTSKEFR